MSRSPYHIQIVIWIVMACFFVPSAWADAKDSSHRLRKVWHVPGELLIKYKHSVRSATSKHRRPSGRFATLRRFRSVGIHHVKIPEGMTLDEALESCRQDPEVEYAEPNYRRYASVDPDDPYFVFGDLWGLEKINMPGAWDVQTGSEAVVLAVLDTGVDWNHEDLAANIWTNPGEDVGLDSVPNTGDPGEGDGIVQPEEENDVDDDDNGYVDDFRGWDFVENLSGEEDNDPDDDHGHGTHVSGTIGAEGNNGIGITGVTSRLSIMPMKTLDETGSGSVADEVAAIDYAISKGAKVINASFSGPKFSRAEYDAINRSRAAGILLVAVAGNYGDGYQNKGWDTDVAEQANYPASYDLENIISVAATDRNDALASFSNYGAISVDVAAPGVQIYSTTMGTMSRDEYDEKSGTSMAAPHVAGLAALIWAEDLSQNGGITFTYIQVKNRILNGVDVLPLLTGDVLMAGRINAQNSIDFTITAPDAAPIDLEASPTSGNRIDLSWTDLSFDESGFKIERATTSGGPYSHLATVASGVESYADTEPPDGTLYYRVGAFNAGGTVYSDEAHAIARAFAAPTDLAADSVSNTQIDLSWRDNSSSEWGYKIERKPGLAEDFTEIASVGKDVRDYIDGGLNGSTIYYYRVRAFKGNEFSDYSNVARTETLSTSSVSNVDGSTPAAVGGGGGGGGCFISAGEYSILSTLWLLLMAFIFVGFVAWLGMPRRITIKGTSKNCL